MTIEEFLAARLEEDYAAAISAAAGPWDADEIGIQGGSRPLEAADDRITVAAGVQPREAAHIVRHDPTRVLREVAAGRDALKDLKDAEEAFENTFRGDYHRHDAVRIACRREVRRLAMAWFDHPEYPGRQ